MDIQHMRAILHFIGLLILITKFSNGQSVTLTGPSLIQQGTDTVYTCTGGAAPYTFIWEDLSVIPIVNIFINGKAVTNPSTHPKYVNFGVSENEGTSTMTITNTLVEDEGQYKCVELPVGTGNIDGAELTVEVKSIRNLSVKTITESNIDVFEAICEALGGRPDETITWMLDDGPSPCDDTNVTYPAAGEGLSSKRSVCTFQATSENIGQTLKCVISGHQVYDLNGEKTTTLNIQRSPTTDIRVGFQFLEPNLTVSCDIADPTQPIPSIMNYYIYSDGTLIHQSPTGDNDVEVPCSEFDLYTEFTCVAGNYLGNTTSDPARYDPTNPTLCTCVPTGLSSGACAAIAVLATLLVASVIINIIQFIMLRRQKTRPELPVNDSMTWIKDCMRLHWTCDIKPCSDMQRSYNASTSYTLNDGRI
ncbi:cell adhesion molecule 3-like [Strongylocentrotus purpuratus]|uniref:Ig-like domain-containing protein n=1 Tax=Strongylocentrotus purpuratus TaxID=7668 RepID=A0A7M7SVP4_STRPU|nr:cell adhesion molecule 3-like [Strongylocentrotus purpuratus]